MLKKTGPLALIFIAALILALPPALQAAEFSADLYQEARGMTMTGKIYVKGAKVRSEMHMPGQNTVSIIDTDKGRLITLMPGQKMYMEMQAKPQDMRSYQTPEEFSSRARIEKLGTETVQGYKCDKYRVIHQDPQMGSSTHWIAKKLNFPIKVISKGSYGEALTEYRNIKEGGVPDSMFEAPPGYRKFQMPGMGPMHGGQGMPKGYPMPPR